MPKGDDAPTVPDILIRLDKGAGAATINAGRSRSEGRPAEASLWDQFAANMEQAAAEIRRLKNRRGKRDAQG